MKNQLVGKCTVVLLLKYALMPLLKISSIRSKKNFPLPVMSGPNQAMSVVRFCLIKIVISGRYPSSCCYPSHEYRIASSSPGTRRIFYCCHPLFIVAICHQYPNEIPFFRFGIIDSSNKGIKKLISSLSPLRGWVKPPSLPLHGQWHTKVHPQNARHSKS